MKKGNLLATVTGHTSDLRRSLGGGYVGNENHRAVVDKRITC